MSIWDCLNRKPDPSVVPEKALIEQLTERALKQAEANQKALEAEKARVAKTQREQERLAQSIAARYGERV